MNSMKKLIKKISLAMAQMAVMVSLFTARAYAITLSTPITSTSLTVSGIANLIVKAVFGVGIIVCLVFLVFYGIKYITAGDDVKAIEGARKGITGAIIGLVVIVLTFAIIKLVAVFFGVKGNSFFDLLPDSYSF